MLDDASLDVLMGELGVKPAGRAYVKRVISGPPSRRGRGGHRSMTPGWPSPKMNCLMYLDSVGPELSLAIRFDEDPSIHGYWNQPEPIKILYQDAEGRKHGFWYTPDFLSISLKEIVLWQAKNESALYQLREERPMFYQLDNENVWHMQRADAACEELGLLHRVFFPTQEDIQRLRNVTFLKRYLK